MYAAPVQELIDELGRLPGIGPKSAQRIAFHILRLPSEEALRLSRAVEVVKARVSWCRRCYNIAEGTDESTLCGICADERRDPHVVVVVEQPKDIIVMERTRSFSGRYHVLQGAISHIDGIGPEQLRIRELLARIPAEGITELILCLSATIEGDATVLYLSELLKPLPVHATRVANGIPVGGDLEYVDELTLLRAFEGRRPVDA